jgi:branched-chain amino acid transport system substrate-binding protein
MRWIWTPCAWLFVACNAVSPSTQTPEPEDREPVPTVLDTPVDFSGSRGATTDPAQLHEIRIGLFAPTENDHPVGAPMYRAAQLAIEQINANGGFRGVPLRIMTRWDNDPWRGGSKQMIKLVYEDSVWAAIGSVDGTATHIAEQVIAKAWVPLLSPVSADPTLTYVRIPWMFRLPPDDQAQAETIVSDGLQVMSLNKVGLITSTDHDGRVFAEEMLDQMQAGRVPPVFHFEVSPASNDMDEIARRALSFSPEGIVLRLSSPMTLALLDRLRRDVSLSVFLPWTPGLLQQDLEGSYNGRILCVQPFSPSDPGHSRFAAEYRIRYGVNPTPGAAYTYDAVYLIARSLEQSGLNRAKLRDAIAAVGSYTGVTGAIRWDNAGGNEARPVLDHCR